MLSLQRVHKQLVHLCSLNTHTAGYAMLMMTCMCMYHRWPGNSLNSTLAQTLCIWEGLALNGTLLALSTSPQNWASLDKNITLLLEECTVLVEPCWSSPRLI